MSGHPLPVPRHVTPALSGYAESLADALRSEARMLEELVRVLERQRHAVALNDLTVVDDSVYGAQRVLLTLQQARRRRHNLMNLVLGREDVPLGGLETALGPRMSESLRSARDDLQATARRLARELDVNRQVLRGAISTGDELIRTLCGVPSEAPMYAPDAGSAEPASAGSGHLFNTQV